MNEAGSVAQLGSLAVSLTAKVTSFTKGMDKAIKKIDQFNKAAKNAGVQFQTSFKQIGTATDVSVKDLSARMGKTDEALGRVEEKMKKSGITARKAAKGVDVMADSLNKVATRGKHALGAVLSFQAGVANFIKLNVRWFAVWRTFWAIWGQILRVGQDIKVMYDETALALRTAADATDSWLVKQRIAIELRQDAIKATQEHAIELKDYIQTVYFLTTAGLTYTKAQKFTNTALLTSIALNEKAADTTRLLTGLYNVFGETIGGNRTELEKFQHISAILTETFRKQDIELKDYIKSLPYTAQQFKMLGIEIEVLVAALGVMGTHFIRGSKAGTSATRTVIEMISKAEKMAEVTGKMYPEDKPLRFMAILRDLAKVIREDKESLDEMGISTKLAGKVFEAVGRRGQRFALTMADALDKVADQIERNKNATFDQVEAMAALVEATPTKQLVILGNNFRAIFTNFLTGITSTGQLTEALILLNDVMRDIVQVTKVLSVALRDAIDLVLVLSPLYQIFSAIYHSQLTEKERLQKAAQLAVASVLEEQSATQDMINVIDLARKSFKGMTDDQEIWARAQLKVAEEHKNRSTKSLKEGSEERIDIEEDYAMERFKIVDEMYKKITGEYSVGIQKTRFLLQAGFNANLELGEKYTKDTTSIMERLNRDLKKLTLDRMSFDLWALAEERKNRETDLGKIAEIEKWYNLTRSKLYKDAHVKAIESQRKAADALEKGEKSSWDKRLDTVGKAIEDYIKQYASGHVQLMREVAIEGSEEAELIAKWQKRIEDGRYSTQVALGVLFFKLRMTQNEDLLKLVNDGNQELINAVTLFSGKVKVITEDRIATLERLEQKRIAVTEKAQTEEYKALQTGWEKELVGYHKFYDNLIKEVDKTTKEIIKANDAESKEAVAARAWQAEQTKAIRKREMDDIEGFRQKNFALALKHNALMSKNMVDAWKAAWAQIVEDAGTAVDQQMELFEGFANSFKQLTSDYLMFTMSAHKNATQVLDQMWKRFINSVLQGLADIATANLVAGIGEMFNRKKDTDSGGIIGGRVAPLVLKAMEEKHSPSAIEQIADSISQTLQNKLSINTSSPLARPVTSFSPNISVASPAVRTNIVNVLSPDLVPAAILRDPATVINVISQDIIDKGLVSSVIKGIR